MVRSRRDDVLSGGPAERLWPLPELARAGEGSRVDYLDAETGFEIPVRVFGESGAGPPVILTHGLQSHSAWFVQSARALADGGSPVYAMDRRGSGLSEAPRGACRDFREMVVDIRVVVDRVREAHGVRRVHLVGHCFGAIPATAYACQANDDVASLILATPGIHTFTDLTLGEKLRVAGSRFGLEDQIRVPLETDLFTDSDRFREFIRNDPLSLRRANASFYYQVREARRYIDKNVDALRVPVFMALAGRDQICDNVRNRAFFERIPSSRKLLVEYSGARHILEFSDDREAFFDELRRWLEPHRSPAEH